MNIPISQETCPKVTRNIAFPSTAKRRQALATEEEPRTPQSFPAKKSREHIDYVYELNIPQSFSTMKLLEHAKEKCSLPMNEASLTCGNEINQLHAEAISRGKVPWLTIKT
jgi:hypothetical protein